MKALADQVPSTVDFFEVAGSPAFLIRPKGKTGPSPRPWVWYAPVIGHPNTSHAWMLKQWLAEGIGMAGVDVGESYGSPRGRKVFTSLWLALTTRYGMSERPCLLPQSRGGLMLYNWAAENPERVACIAGIYTVCDLLSYPGLEKASGAYGMNAADLEARLAEHNPIDRLAPLAKVGVPILHVHGDADHVVPLEKNSSELARRYRALGGQVRLIVIPGKGHQVCPEFFQCQELVDFVIVHAKQPVQASRGGWAIMQLVQHENPGPQSDPQATPPKEITFYVSPSGNDGWTGKHAEPNAMKTDGPFAALQRARDEARRAGRDHARRIIVRGGTYYLRETFALGKEDSGTDSAPVQWQAAPGEEVRLVGGRLIPPEAFGPVTDSSVLARLDAASHGKVLQADFAKIEIAVPGVFPARFRGPPPTPELFFNDQRMTLARWPNEGWTTIAKIIDAGSEPRSGDNTGRPGVFEYSGDRPARWSVESGVWLHGYWCFDWYEEVIQVGAIDPAKRRITLAEPHLYSLRQGNPSPRRYRAINLLEELDQPGEYYFDRSGGRLYFWPPAALPGSRIVLATLSAPVISLNETAHVALRGFIVEASQGDGIEVSGGTSNRIQACRVRNIRQLGVRVSGGTGHRVEGCDIHDTGTGGLVLAGGDRKTLSAAGHQAVNNHIWRFSQHQLTYANAILLEGVGNRAAHNLIHDAPHQAVGVNGNDHVFEYNVVHHVCAETDDCGAFYKGRNPSCRGNVVRYNFWHNIGSPMGHGNAAVYFDDGDGGDTVFGNVFFRCGDPGRGPFGTVFSHGGHDNLAENNIFIECKRALGSAPWDDGRWKRAVEGGEGCEWQTRLLKEVDITKPPYTTRYPSLIGFMNPVPGQPRVNRAVRNLIVMCADVHSGNWHVSPNDNWITNRDPGFVDAAKGDFRLRPDAEVFTRLPGFEPIPFEKIGLYTDELRLRPAAEPWTYGPPMPLLPLAK